MMADIIPSSAVLPTIKCSSCAMDIGIAVMGEHVCSGSVPAGRETTPPPESSIPLDKMRYYQQAFPDGSSLLKPGRMMPPIVDTSAANRSFFPQDQLTPASSASHSRSASPLTPHDRLRLPSEKSSRVNESSTNQRPLTPTQLTSNLDSAFPRFPTPQATGSPRLRNAYGAQSPRYEKPDPITYIPYAPGAKLPANLKIPTNAASLEKIESSAQGTLATTFQRASNPKEGQNHHRSFTVGLIGEPEKFDPTPSRVLRHSRSSTNISSVNFPMPPRRKGYGALEPSAWAGEDAPAHARPEAIRSQTFPRRQESMDVPTSRRNPSIPSNSHGPHLSKKSFSGPPPQGASLIRGRSGHKAGDLPPLPNINLEAEFGANNPYHSPSVSLPSIHSQHSSIHSQHSSVHSQHSSIHSHHSSISQGSQASSRSSPTSTSGSDYHKRQQSTSRISDLMSEITSSIASISTNELFPRSSDLEPVKEQEPCWPLSPAFESPGYATNTISRPPPAHRVPSPAPLKPHNCEPLSAPFNPQLRNRSAPILNSYQGSHIAPPFDHSKPLPDPHGPTTSKATGPTTSKGNCKACTLPIKGKSISSADGRLTGRYHKSCFVCTTCRASFLTSEFYVHDDAPYCEHHYHQLNNSLCHGCDRGIEGQYLESVKKQKFHPSCLNCADCNMNLRHDYFEMGAKIYCERDALRRAQEGKVNGDFGASFGGQTTKMQRRTTRLMMM
ncbi:hypothetical protein DSL72_002531 [Monilinia vaccinii-corymbosi]|uniref:LIM zinc-binding domain-containing protein n=1 Tax=Monilinia vaccinii-corymbosi TaxID=61207 RepID=A0A8A3PCY1_9HELO|nr:hypothetical protein DSL72_002531 [Monilinia vaccinii-corymbosi]